MAFDVLRGIFAADASEYTSEIDDAAGATGDFEDSVDNTAGSLFDLDPAGAAAGGAIAAIGGAIENTTQNTQDMREFLGRTAQSMGLTSGEANSLARSISSADYPLEDVTATMDSAARQGVETAEDMQRVAGAADNIADATGTTAEAITDSVGPALSAFGDGLEDIEDHQDTFTYVNRNTTQSVEDFGGMINRSSDEIQELGLDLDETAAIMAALEDEGYQGRQAIQKFREATNEADGDQEAFMETLGLSDENLEKHSEGLENAEGMTDQYADAANESVTTTDRMRQRFEEAQLALGGMLGPVDALGPALMGLGGTLMTISTINMATVIPSFTATATTIAPVAAPLLAVAAAAGVLYYAFDNDIGSIRTITETAFGRAREVVEPFASVLRDDVAETVESVGGRIDTVTTRIGNDWEELEPRVMPVLSAIGGALELVFVQGVDNAVTVLRAGLAIVRGDFDDLEEIVMGWRDRTVGRMERAGGDAITALSSGIQSVIGRPRERIEEGMARVRHLLPGSDADEGPLSDLTSAGESLPMTFAAGIFNRITYPHQRAFEMITDVASLLPFDDGANRGPLTNPASAGSDFVTALSGGISSLAEDPIDTVFEIVSKIGDWLPFGDGAVTGPLTAPADAGTGLISSITSGIDLLAEDPVDRATGIVTDIGDRLPFGDGAVTGPLTSPTDAGTDLVSSFTGGIDLLSDDPVGSIRGIADDISDRLPPGAIGPLSGSNLRSAGEAVSSSLASGISSGASEARDAASSLASSVRSHLPGSDADEGPLSDLSTAGEALPETFVDSAESKTGRVAQMSDRLAEAATITPRAENSGAGSGGGQSVSFEGAELEIKTPTTGDSDLDQLLSLLIDLLFEHGLVAELNNVEKRSTRHRSASLRQ
ncbi:phage tail tape measure protein [Natrononativus amylolyticus]|uniref:phage tail tape measure protein n=1 Tax=Natrononativus amylolyticus TaxID=2963434 RepID=UPI0020CF38B6|nr:phage tail tape measure protein [Natrononativus amylolyticus]